MIFLRFFSWKCVCNLKIHKATLETISSYPVRFSEYILLSSLVSFVFCLLVIIVLKLEIYILVYIWLCRRVSVMMITSIRRKEQVTSQEMARFSLYLFTSTWFKLPLAVCPITPCSSHLRLRQGVVVVLDCPCLGFLPFVGLAYILSFELL